MPICPNGHEVDANTAFCRQCGAPLAPPDEPTVVLAPVPSAHSHAAARPAQSNTAVYVLAGALVLIGLVAIGLVLVLGGSNDDSGRPTPIAQDTVSTSPSPSSTGRHHPSASPTGVAIPAGGTTCPGTLSGGGTFGTIGSETSCGFVQAVEASYVDSVGLNQSPGQTATITATSPATGKTYTGIVCTVGDQWITCVGGNNDTARMFFAHP